MDRSPDWRETDESSDNGQTSSTNSCSLKTTNNCLLKAQLSSPSSRLARLSIVTKLDRRTPYVQDSMSFKPFPPNSIHYHLHLAPVIPELHKTNLSQPSQLFANAMMFASYLSPGQALATASSQRPFGTSESCNVIMFLIGVIP